MIYIQFEAMPSQTVATRENVAGAYVCCRIRTDDRAEAEQLGRQWISEQEWIVVSVEEFRPIDLEAEGPGPNARYIREAAESGGSLVFHRWSGRVEAPRA
jgi:hypothetical protein